MPCPELEELQELCEAPVPDDYVALLKNYPPEFLNAVRADDADMGTIATVELLASLQDIIAINREARSQSVLDPDGNEFYWPTQLVVIGETGTGDYYCIDVDGDEPGVLQYLHQSCEFEVAADSLEEFVGLIREAFLPDMT